MLLSPEIDAMKAQMTAIIVRDSEGFFDDPKENEDLQITVRVACNSHGASSVIWSMIRAACEQSALIS
jgi:hypothetical protein